MPFLGSIEFTQGAFTQKSSTFSPKSVSGIQLWVDASDSSTITLSGSNVTGLLDKSGTSKTLYVSNGATSNVGYTGGNSLIFTETNAHVGVSSMPNAPYDTFLVCTANTVITSYRTMFRGNTATGTHQFLLAPNTSNVGMWTGSAFAQFGTITQSANEKALFYTTMASGKTIQATKNGTESLTSAVGPTTAADNGVIMWIGNSWALGTAGQGGSGGGQPFGQLQETIVYNRALTLSERQIVEGYLAWKWGLQGNLPSNHPYKNQPPA